MHSGAYSHCRRMRRPSGRSPSPKTDSVLSQDAEIARSPSGLTTTPLTPPPWPSRVQISAVPADAESGERPHYDTRAPSINPSTKRRIPSRASCGSNRPTSSQANWPASRINAFPGGVKLRAANRTFQDQNIELLHNATAGRAAVNLHCPVARGNDRPVDGRSGAPPLGSRSTAFA